MVECPQDDWHVAVRRHLGICMHLELFEVPLS